MANAKRSAAGAGAPIGATRRVLRGCYPQVGPLFIDDFIPPVRDIYAQWRANRHRCIPRNTDLAIAADGSYQYCFDDIRHSHAIGHVAGMSIRDALSAREREGADPRLCNDCGVRRRYGPLEVGRVLLAYMRA